ncbi:uncharacterized protein LOC112088142 [Eutrema salsugineum]|uniref:uncharacterized protein LOC112088142 n=1 Tax=Eutrema salsugineum TaxID=72664 RepID=UPI000CED51E2|nr:uncharacterized protein LOC112088142 [Eutrema salsugineum]
MNLEEDLPIDILADGAFCAVERSARSLIGRLLNPDVQNMARMLRSMPRIWRIYERVKGVALTDDTFQFIFDWEQDMNTVLKAGFWTFDEWGLVMERWVENPPADFLKKAPVWIKLHKIPVNYFTLATIDAVVNRIGHVKEIAYDPAKPLLQAGVRVCVAIDLDEPVRDAKSLNLPDGKVAIVEIEYERKFKKCFNCSRLTHEKQRCPLLQRNKTRSVEASGKQNMRQQHNATARQHHPNLSEQIMPMLAPTVPPGFSPHSNLVAPEVFEQMRIYMSSGDPSERSLRELKMKKTLDELSKDPVVQRSYLRLEAPPVFTASPVIKENEQMALAETSSGRNQRDDDSLLPSDHSSAGNGNQDPSPSGPKDDGAKNEVHPIAKEVDLPLADATMGHMGVPDPLPQTMEQFQEGSGFFAPPLQMSEFRIGCVQPSSSGTSNRSKKSNSGRWSRQQRAKQGVSLTKDQDQDTEHPSKRKAVDSSEVTSKLSKQSPGLMVHQTPSNPSI